MEKRTEGVASTTEDGEDYQASLGMLWKRILARRREGGYNREPTIDEEDRRHIHEVE
ncbi:MAG: hypothetical protein RX318_03745 [bacterium]|nr:hypothetical protein [bacterium]